MKPLSSASRPAEATQSSPSQNHGGQPNAQHHAPPVSSPADVDGNPRSPKRRRILGADDRRELEAETEATGPNPQSMTGTQPPYHDDHAQNIQTKSLPEASAQNIAHIPQKLHAQDVANPSSTGQAQNAATTPKQQPPPLQHSPLEHLSTLDQQASLILTFLSRLTPAEAMGLSNKPNAPSSRDYAALRAAFDRTRRLVSPGWPFLPQHDLGPLDSSQIEIIRKANQAIFMSSIFTGEIGLRDMDRSFLAVFVPENGELSQSQGAMYLDLKTQGFITAWRTGAAPPGLVMRDMFGPDLDKALLTRRPGTTTLTSVEQEFLQQLNSRRSILENAVNTKTLDQLPVTYKWEDFSREVSSYLIAHIEKSSRNGPGVAGEDRSKPAQLLDRGQMQGQFSIHGQSLAASSTVSMAEKFPVEENWVALLEAAADVALRSVLGLSPSDPIPPMPPSPSISTPAPIAAVQPGLTTPQSNAPELNLTEPSEKLAPEPLSPSAHKEKRAGEGTTDAPQIAPAWVLYERTRSAANVDLPTSGHKILEDRLRSEPDGLGDKQMVQSEKHVEEQSAEPASKQSSPTTAENG